MKKILSLLMCYVFLQTETFALRGGPNSGNGEKVTGQYSGVMVENDGKGSDLGLFLLTAVSNGASNGSMVIFSASTTTLNAFAVAGESDIYSGNISGISDTSRGGTGTFYGLFHAEAKTGSGAQRSANGQMTVTAKKAAGQNSTQRLTGTASSQTVSIDSVGGNTATSSGPNKTYAVDGWVTGSSTGTVNGFSIK